MVFVWTPTLMTRWYEYLRIEKIYKASLIFAIICFTSMFFIYDTSLSFSDKGNVLVLMAPLLFLIIFKLFDNGALKLYKRHSIITNWYTIKHKEKYKAYDVIGFLAMTILPFFIPIFIREIIK